MSALIINKPTHGEYLFIGGGQDGLRRYVKHPNDVMSFHVKQDMPDIFSAKPPETAPLMNYDEYRLSQIHGHECRFFVYLHSSLTGDDLMKCLIRGYSKRTDQ
jgi:hypothetical protein